MKINPISKDGVTKEPTLVKGIPDGSLTVAENRFKFNCPFRHCGDLDGRVAHYVAWIRRENKWICFSDEDVQPQYKWPINGYDKVGKKSPYLLFYSQA